MENRAKELAREKDLSLKGLSPEGIPYGQYRWLELILSLPPALGLVFLLWLIRQTTQEEDLGDLNIPENAIVFLLHPDQFVTFLNQKFWKKFSARRFSWLGFHGFLSYVGSLWSWMEKMRCFRFDRARSEKPMDQVMHYLLNEAEGIFLLRTDSGGPYSRVRGSLVRMAIESGRPVVGVRQLADSSLEIHHHHFPLPFTRTRNLVTRAIYPIELQALSVENARRLLQEEVDSLLLK